jgi:hypothetical protein
MPPEEKCCESCRLIFPQILSNFAVNAAQR